MSYDFIYDKIIELSEKKEKETGKPVKTVLDIGCGYGGFVQELRKRGFDAYGVDVSPRRFYWYIRKGDARNLKACFGKKKFDVITANGVLCIGGQGDMLKARKKNGTMKRLENDLEKTVEYTRKNAIKVLKSCYNQMNSPGFYIEQEATTEWDRIFYSEKDARNAGFKAEELNRWSSVLAKK